MTYDYLKEFVLLLFLLFILQGPIDLYAQDTLRVNLAEFIEQGIEKSGMVAYEQRATELAHNQADQAKAMRILPSINLNTQHGLIPGVESSKMGLKPGSYYLDPDIRNNWEDWAIFTRGEISAVQPLYTWGAVDNAIKAATAGARAAEYQFDAVQSEAEFRYFELYYSYLLALEVSRILDDAKSQISQVERAMEEMREDGSLELKESDIFKFEIFRSEFETRIVEVEQGLGFVQRVWNYALQAPDDIIYEPEERFLDPVSVEIESYDHYRQLAFDNRAELMGVDAGIEATRSGLEAVKAQQYPVLFFGLTGSFAYTPNRPRQTNPFIRNNTNYLSAAVGFGIRQNLNFQELRNNVNRATIEHKRMYDLREALSEGVVLELNETYREAVIAESKVRQTEESLAIARNWVRNEQLNYDLGFGDMEELVDAVRQELELRVELKQNVFELNKKMAALYKASGVPVTQMNLN